VQEVYWVASYGFASMARANDCWLPNSREVRFWPVSDGRESIKSGHPELKIAEARTIVR
jgi:hypothetical protein